MLMKRRFVWLDRLQGRRRWLVAAAVAVVVVVVVVVRVLLPAVLRRVLTAQASDALRASVEVGDVDLALWKGGVTLEDVVVRPAGPPTDPPADSLVAWKRLAVELRWLPLFRRTIQLRMVAFDEPQVALDRLEDGTLNLMQLGSTSPAPPTTTPPAPTTSTTLPATATDAPASGWAFGIDRLVLRAGWLRFRDLKLKAVEPVEVFIDNIDVREVGLTPEVYGGPSRLRLAAEIGRGSLRVDARVALVPEGVSVDADVKAKRLPLRRLRVYIPRVGWSDLHGELAAALETRFESGHRTEVSGTVILQDMAVRVPALEEPALAWRRLRVRVHPLDVLAQRVAIESVDLDGATLVIRPRGGDLLPLLALAVEEGAAASPTGKAAPAEDSPPWHWSVASLRVTDARLHVLAPETPLDVGVALTAHDLAADSADPAPITIALTAGEGTVGVDAAVRIAPPGVDGTVTIDRLSLPELVAAAGVLPPQLLQVGRLAGTLQVAAGSAAPPGDVRVRGTLALTEPWLAAADQHEFAVGAFAVNATIDEIHVPGVLAPAGTAPGPIRVRLARLDLEKPYVQLTRTAEGLVLPPFTAASPGTAPPPADSSAPAPQVDITALRVTAGRVYVTDRTVTPFYVAAIDPWEATVDRLHWPDLALGKVHLAATLDERGKIDVTGTLAPAGGELQVNTRDVVLSRFNPHALAMSSYTISKGRLEVNTKATFGPGRYDAISQLTLRDFDLASREGDSLFQEQFGIPLRMALALLRDVHGDIGLDIPVQGDAEGTRVGLMSVIGQALRRALLNALASPLKLAGMVFGEGGEQALAPAPIAFRPGRDVLAPDSERQVEQLASLLASRPGLGVTLTAVGTPADVRWLREQALREELAGKQGVVGALRNLPARGARERVRTALEARAQDEAGPLEPDDAEALERWLAERPSLPPERLQAVAAARLATLAGLLRERYGLGPERVTATEPGAEPGEEPPAVRFELGAVAAP